MLNRLADETLGRFSVPDTALLDLAPSHLPSYRKSRYQGENERVNLEAFAEPDRQLLGVFYNALLRLYLALKPHHGDLMESQALLSAYLQTAEYQNLADLVSPLGHATAKTKPRDEVGRLIHDIRGGAFQALFFRLQLLEIKPNDLHGLQNVYFLVRDHLKIMRNCVADLDPPRFHADSLHKAHDIELLVEKWSHTDFHAVKKPVRVEFDCLYQGTICESCLEFSSLDRIIYNLMNNASRYTADEKIYFHVLPVPAEKPDNLRFVILNKVTSQQRQILDAQLRGDPGEIFRGGFTTDGNGLGGRICAEFCSHAYGIFDFDEAKQGGYFGAKWMDDYFAAWFHWPMVRH